MNEETVKPTQEELEIYDYMNDVYDRHTKDGEHYIPEVHDPMIEEMAAEKFSKTTKEIGEIYCRIAWEIMKTENGGQG